MAFFVVMYSSAAANVGDKGTRGSSEKPPESMAKKQEGKEGEKASASAENERMDRIMDSLYNRFGPEWTITNCWTGGPRPARSTTAQRAKRQRIQGKFAALDDPGKYAGRLPAPKPDEYLVAGGTMYFDGEQAALSKLQAQQLRAVAAELAGKPQKLEIRGHTSRQPLSAGSAFHDHCDLAYARCRAVRDCLVSYGLDPRRFRLAIAADTEPMQIAGDPLELRRSSRVELRLLPEYVDAVTGLEEKVRPPAVSAAK